MKTALITLVALGCIAWLFAASGCGDNAQNAGAAALLIFASSSNEQAPQVSDEEREAYSRQQSAEYWGKHGYKTDSKGWPIGYYEDNNKQP